MAKKIDFTPIDFVPENADTNISFNPEPDPEGPQGQDFPGADAVGVTDGPTPAAQAKKPETPVSKKLEALVQGFGQGSTLGYMPQAQALMAQYVTDPLAEKVYGVPASDTYVKLRDAFNKRDKNLQEAAPGYHTGGTVMGALTTALTPMGAAKSLGGKMLVGGLTGGASGLAMNPGEEEGVIDPLQMDERLSNAKSGAIIGATIPAAGKGLHTLAKYLKDKSARAAYKSIGPYVKDASKHVPRGKEIEIGQELIDENIVGGLPKSWRKIKNMAADRYDEVGKDLESYLNELSETIRKSTDTPGLAKPGEAMTTKMGLIRQQIAARMREELINPDVELPGVVAKNAKVEKLIRQFEEGGEDVIDVLRGEHLKRSVNKEINWDRLKGQDVPIEEQVQRELSKNLQKGVEEGAEYAEKHLNLPSAGKFKTLKRKYGALKEASEIAERKDIREMVKNFTFDAMAGTGLGGLGYLTTEDPEKKLENALLLGSLGYANRLRRDYGQQIMTNVWGNLGNLSKGSALVADQVSELAAKNPWAFMNTVNMLRREDDNGRSR